VVFIDDISIYSKAKEDHERHLRLVLQVLKEKKLYAKLKKCEFWLDSVTFLGHVISKDGISVDPKKVEAVVEWNRPNNVTKRFLVSWVWRATTGDLLKASLA
jgi:hypothetical protein